MTMRLLLRSALMLPLLALPARAAETPKTGAGIHYVYLIRHGIYDPDTSRMADDFASNGLNLLGHEQARLVGARLAALPVRPASLVASNYRRARETAADIGALLHMSPVVDTLLHECSPASDFPGDMRGPESTAACDSNLARAWAKYLVPSPESDRHDVLVSHSGVIRWFVSRALGDARHWRAMEMANGSITIIAVRPDGTTRLVCFNDVGHLPVSKQTWTGKGAGWGAPVK